MTKGYQAKGRGGSQKSLGLDHMTLKGCGPGLDLWCHGKARGSKQGSGMKDLRLWKSILAPVTEGMEGTPGDVTRPEGRQLYSAITLNRKGMEIS